MTRIIRAGLLAALVVTGVGSAAPVAVGQDGALDFPPMLMPFPAGSGEIISGYGGGRHTGGSEYSLDMCANPDCSIGDPVLAPTDLVWEWSGSYNQVHDDRDDYHVFRVAEDADRRLCVALGHFDLTAKGTTFERGQELGTLLDYRTPSGTSIPHIHIGIWSVPSGVICAVSDASQRTAVPFTGMFELDGRSYEQGRNHEGPVVSTNDGEGGGTGQPVEAWRVPSDASYAWSPEAVGGRLYVGSNDPGGAVAVLLDARSGTEVGRFGSGERSLATVIPGPSDSVIVAEGDLAATGQDPGNEAAWVTAFDVASGEERWRYEPDVDKVELAICDELVIVSGGTFRGEGASAAVMALDASTGGERWRVEMDLADVYAPTVDAGVLYFGSYRTDGGAELLALDCATGDERWRYRDDVMWHIESPAITDGLAVTGAFSYARDQGGVLLALDLASGDQVWQTEPGLDVVYSPTVSGGRAYAGTFDSSGEAALLAADAATGDLAWRHRPSPGVETIDSPAIDGADLVIGVGSYGSADRGAVMALDADGQVRWTFAPDPPVQVAFSPTIVDGLAVTGTYAEDGAPIVAISTR